MKKLPPLAQVQGAMLEERTPHQRVVVVQCSDHKGELYEFELPFEAAMSLLSFLRQAQEDAASWDRSS